MQSYKFYTALILIILFVGVVFVKSLENTPHSLGSGGMNTYIEKFSDSSEVLVGTTSTLLLATSSGSRQYARFTNQSVNATIYLEMTGGKAASLNKGVAIRAGESYAIQDINLYQGGIYAISSSTAASTTVAAKQ